MNILYKKIGRRTLWQYLPHIIRHDFARKLMQLILTILIFAAYHLSQNQERRDQNMPEVTISNVRVILSLEKNLCLLSEKYPRCEVTVKGWDLSGLSNSNIEVLKKITVKDYEKWKDGNEPTMKLEFSAEDVRFRDKTSAAKKEIKVTNVEGVEVLVDTSESKVISEIKPVFDKSGIPDDYRVRVSPVRLPGESFSGVTISGPNTKLEKIKELQTERFKITNSVSYDTTVQMEDLNGDLKYVGDDTVRLHVEIIPPAPRTFEKVPLQVLLPPDLLKKGYSIAADPKYVKVKIRGHEKVSSVRDEHLHPYVNVSEFTAEKEYKIQCWCDENDIQILEVVPDTTIVRLTADYEENADSASKGKE